MATDREALERTVTLEQVCQFYATVADKPNPRLYRPQFKRLMERYKNGGMIIDAIGVAEATRDLSLDRIALIVATMARERERAKIFDPEEYERRAREAVSPADPFVRELMATVKAVCNGQMTVAEQEVEIERICRKHGRAEDVPLR